MNVEKRRFGVLATLVVVVVALGAGVMAIFSLQHEKPYYGVEVGMTYREVLELAGTKPYRDGEHWASVNDDTHFGIWNEPPPPGMNAMKLKIREWAMDGGTATLNVAFDANDRVVSRNDTRPTAFSWAKDRISDLWGYLPR